MPAPRWPGCVARGTSFYLQGLPHLQRGLMLMTVGGRGAEVGCVRGAAGTQERGQEEARVTTA